MARDLNKVSLTGRLGKAVELRYTPSGSAVATFSVASNRPIKQPDNSWKDEAEWFRIVAWDKLAERCAEQLTKGRHVYIEGRLQTRKWTDKTGQEKYTTEVVASDMITLDKKPEGQDGWGNNTGSVEADGPDPEDIPF